MALPALSKTVATGKVKNEAELAPDCRGGCAQPASLSPAIHAPARGIRKTASCLLSAATKKDVADAMQAVREQKASSKHGIKRLLRKEHLARTRHCAICAEWVAKPPQNCHCPKPP
mmetsp:Transcript_5419/g.10196  ORF Transcript_5419/g.10196 Transcript_5419/m.10196 type:complete len:116 (+) Transcript_5419:759-1106(+)